MKSKPDLTAASLAGAGFRLVATTFAGLIGGIALFKWVHWSWAAPLGIVIGFAAGMTALYRDLSRSFR